MEIDQLAQYDSQCITSLATYQNQHQPQTRYHSKCENTDIELQIELCVPKCFYNPLVLALMFSNTLLKVPLIMQLWTPSIER
jgi:hypothetical protein